MTVHIKALWLLCQGAGVFDEDSFAYAANVFGATDLDRFNEMLVMAVDAIPDMAQREALGSALNLDELGGTLDERRMYLCLERGAPMSYLTLLCDERRAIEHVAQQLPCMLIEQLTPVYA